MTQDRRESGAARLPFLAVLFDFGGTLDADGEPSVAQFLRGYHAARGRRSPVEFEEIFGESDRRLATLPGIAALGFRAMLDAQSRLLVDLVRDSEHLDAPAIAGSVHQRVIPIAERNARILGVLRARGVRTGVISNFTGNLEHCLAELGLAPVLDVVVDSAVVGVRKPEPSIFQLALDRVGVAPADALMVGDNPYADVQAAAALGIAACWLAPLPRPVPDGCTPAIRIASLSELLDCLDARLGTPNAQRRICTA